MKKFLISLVLSVMILNLIIINPIYAKTNRLRDLLFPKAWSDGFWNVNLPQEFSIDEVYEQLNKNKWDLNNPFIDGGDGVWGQIAWEICDYAHSKEIGYKEIQENDDIEYILLAKKALEQTKKNKDKLSGMWYWDGTKDEKGIGDLYASTIQELNAAYAYGGGDIKKLDSNATVNIKDSYQTKYNYTKNQIKKYRDLFGNRFNLTEKQKEYLLIKWEKGIDVSTDAQQATQEEIASSKGGTTNKKPSTKYTEEDINEMYTESQDSYNQKLDNYLEEEQSGGTYKLPKNEGKVGDSDIGDDIDSTVQNADDWINSEEGDITTLSQSELQGFSQTLYTILFTIGVVVAVIVGAIIGIKFMTGSVEEKADVKKLLIPYIVGCIVVFGAFAIWQLAVSILSDI